jgi:hypothetical protein
VAVVATVRERAMRRHADQFHQTYGSSRHG